MRSSADIPPFYEILIPVVSSYKVAMAFDKWEMQNTS